MGGADSTSAEERSYSTGHNRERISLAAEAPIHLGVLTVTPSLRQVVHDDGRQQIIEPRVMQVLVALVRAEGRILTRDDLQASCWHGVVVGEDAITRAIGSLRRLSEGIGVGAFKLETITKVGYRLVWPKAELASLPPDGPIVGEAGPVEPLLAVLAFDNISGDPDIAYFSDGVSEEILQTVAQGAELKVIGRGSSFQFRGADKAAAHVAATLKATHVLDGSVRRSGTKVRIAAHLIECADEITLWTDSFDRDLTDIFALQDEIATAVATALKIAISPGAKAASINPVAYDLYLKARETWRKTNSEATRVAVIGFLEPAIALASSFARAWAFLAEVQSIRLRRDDLNEPYAVLRAKVIEAAETALNLDPSLGEVYQSLSRLEPLASYLERWKLHGKALAIAPNDPIVLTNASELCAEIGRNREALEFATQARDLDPIYPWFTMWYANVLDCLGRNVDSRRVREESLTPDSEYEIWMSMASAAGHEDWMWFDKLVRKSHIAGTYNERVRGLVWYASNIRNPNQESLRRFSQRVKVQSEKLGHVSTDNLRILCRFGYANEAFDLVDRTSFTYMVDPEQRPPENLSQSIIFNVNYSKSLMNDPRFPRLCSKLGLCAYWLQTDRWPDCADDGALPYDFKAECRRVVAY